MNVATIQMPKEVAEEKLKAVRKALHRRADREYETLERAYEALGTGTPIVDLIESFRIGGFFDDGRPRLAIARADRPMVRVNERGETHRRVVFDATRDAQSWSWSSSNAAGPTLVMGFPVPDAPPCNAGWSLVPMIPPEVRINNPVSHDRQRFILWEVEEWSDKPLNPEPPRDPMLLEPLVGNLYVVLAHWALTDLERLIMGGRAEV